jgi:hypothetical protein
MTVRSPFYALFTFGLFGSLFLVTGAVGWRITKRNDLFFSGDWIEGPVWSQVAIGAACLVVAAVAYQFASRDPRLRSRLQSGQRQR